MHNTFLYRNMSSSLFFCAWRRLALDPARHDAPRIPGVQRISAFGRKNRHQHLADRRLESHGILETAPDPADGRRQIYTLTDKGIDVAPILTEMMLWAARHGETGNPAPVRQMRTDKRAGAPAIPNRLRFRPSFENEVRRRDWCAPRTPAAGRVLG